jgi:superoxide dismutase, Fe-Mn family
MFTLPDLPFAQDALEPHMSAKTLEFHHGKHHKAYVDKLNALVEGTPLGDLALEEVVQRTATYDDPASQAIFNWNHSFFWKSLSPDGRNGPEGALGEAIARDFGGYAQFIEEFTAKGVEHFGSGWVWLVASGDKLEIITAHDAGTPFEQGKVALLCCDLWEHAYYFDYQNRRPDFLKAFAANLANWRFAQDNFAAALTALDGSMRHATQA